MSKFSLCVPHGYFLKNPLRHVLKSFLCIFISTLVAGCTPNAEVTDVQFGSFSGVGSGNITFRAEKSFSKNHEVVFGWVVSMKNPPEKLTIKEVIKGPEGVVWDVPSSVPGVELTDSGKTVSVTKTVFSPASPFLFHNWTVSSTDPTGNYIAMLFIEGRLVREVRFVILN